MCLVHIDACVCEDSSSGNICSETVMIYDKRSRKLYWWGGFLVLSEYCGWDWGWLNLGFSGFQAKQESILLSGYLGLSGYPRTVHCMNMVMSSNFEVMVFSRFGLIVHVDVKDVSVPGEIALSLWEVFFSYIHKIISYDCLVETISFIFLMVWGAGGVGNWIVLKR